mmetsp:Transcript_22081/g.47610  ORF Transcript_22081/g.47610 Transcript_22081/m.47610 type:complete len:208 (+) Transcript_22081:881-1504(+)
MNGSLAREAFDEGGAHLDTRLGVLERELPLHELLVARRAIGVGQVRLGVALHRLLVLCNGLWELARLEELVALLPRLLALLGRHVGLLVVLLLERVRLFEQLLHLLRAVLHHRVLVRADGLGEVALLLVRVADTGVGLGDELVVSSHRAANLDALFACLDASIKILDLHLHRCHVVVVGDLVRKRLDRFLVVLDGLVKLFALVRGVA